MRTTAFLLLGLLVAGGFALAQEVDLEARVKALENKVMELDTAGGDLAAPNDLRVYWKEALRIETADGKFKFQIGGRVHNDWIFVVDDGDERPPTAEIDEPNTRVLFRRARLYLSGTIYENLEFKFEYDMAGGDADFKDVYAALKEIPFIGRVQAGHFKEPFSLEELTSSNHITFMERSVANAFAPSRSTGLMIGNHCEKVATWAVGVFRDADDYGDDDNEGTGSDWAFTGRVTVCPLYDDEGKTVVHLGVAASHRNPNGDQVQLQVRPEIRTRNEFINTGVLPAEAVNLFGGEAAVVVGPFSAQAEYILTVIDEDTIDATNPRYYGWYVEAGFFVTGENRRYDPQRGAFTRVRPAKNLGEDGGFGAVEIAARMSQIDLNDRAVSTDTGEMTSFTLGTNWYLNPNARVMVNWVHADRDRAEPYDFLGMRFQVDF